MRLSNTHFDPNQPYWLDYLPFLRKLAGTDLPDCDQLNALLTDGLNSAIGAAIRFVPSTELDNGAYEQRIYSNGLVSTRPNNWHDLFNALVWMRFPRIKVAMNAAHHRSTAESRDGSRGAQRDALTLFDECGVIVFSQHRKTLDAHAQRNWPAIFQDHDIARSANYIISGHAMLEKYLSPYKAMTAKALLVKVDAEIIRLPRELFLRKLDSHLAEQLLAGNLLTTPACLTPLPLAGIPGWWTSSQQDAGFYSDPKVFRSAPESLKTVPVTAL